MWMQGFVSFFLPSSWRGVNYIKQAKKLLIPEIIRRREVKDKTPEENNNLLSWMMEIATPDESNPSDLAHLEVVMSLASIHTSQMNAVHVMYDLASRPEYMEPLREEIVQLIKEDGPWKQWQKPSFSKLRKLDSFMRESQRVNPPSLLSYHRVMLSEHVCADGTVIPRDAHICMPVNAIQFPLLQAAPARRREPPAPVRHHPAEYPQLRPRQVRLSRPLLRRARDQEYPRPPHYGL
jgi:hypothetical protein